VLAALGGARLVDGHLLGHGPDLPGVRVDPATVAHHHSWILVPINLG
jgi:hypothetical protein